MTYERKRHDREAVLEALRQGGEWHQNRYRVVGVLTGHHERILWLSWRLLAGQTSEKDKEASMVRTMIEDIREIDGEEVIEWLLMDGLYADGPLLAWLEYACGIHAVVRLPEDRLLMVDR